MTSDGPGSRLSETVGLKLNDGSFEPLIAAGTALPADAMKRFTTAEDNQTQVQIRVFQGSDATAERNDLLGECTLAGIPPAPAGTPGIEVLFSIDEDGSLEVSAQENASGHGQEVKADAGTSLDDVNVEQARSGSDKILGIDLGTTNSAFAVMEGGDPEIIVNDEGDRTTPSVVAFSDGERLVGKPAKNRAVQNPDDTVESIKRHMSEEDYTVELGGDSYTPEQVSAMILQKIKRDAEDYLGDEIDKTVITVPAYFSDHQRQVIKDAGEIAGFDVERMINEPTAASIAYGLNDESDQTVLVYDLGGGSFSLSILELGEGVYEVVATNGDNDLGGDDWDRAIIDWLAEDFYNEHGIDLREDRQALQRLTEAAEEAKIELSNRTETTITLPFIAAADDGPRNLEASLTRAKFESMTRNLVERTVEPTEQALDEIPSRISIDEVVLVGGSTRMPQVRKKIEELTRQEPQKNVNPDEAVALGAAIQGGVLSGDVEDIILLDVTPLSLGVETEGGLFERLIDKNTTIPTVESDVFTTSEDGQTRIRIRVFQGEREIAERNELLGAFTLAGIPPAPAGEPRIEVTLLIDEDGIVNVEAEDRGSGTSENITIEGDTVTESGGSGDGEASDAARPAMAEETETGGSGSEKRIAPDTLEELIERALSVRDELHRGRLYCRRSEDHGIADIRDNLENTVEKIRDVTGSSPAGRGSESESSSKRLRTTLESVSETLEESVGEPVSASWSVEDLDVVIGELDGALVDVGLELIDPDPGDETDPYRHHALSSTESSLPEGTVASVQQVGYERDGQVRQEARVIVSSGGAPESSGDTDLEIREEKIPDIERFGSPPRASLTHGDIEVGRLLGSGGQASVYEATVPALETPSRIALKEPAHGGRTLTEETVASFFERARTWRTVDDRERNKRRWDSYEHVVGVVDVGHQRPWIALEYMDGGSLGDRLDGSPDGLPVGEAVWIAHCLCKALEVAHSYGIAHLDLKPDNVLFAETGSGRWDVPKLADWGLARKLAEGTGSMEALSPTYAAPEQFEPQDFGDPDSITDVYQVGANLYAMLTGEPPATGSHLAVMKTVLNDDPPAPPSDKGSNAPPGLNDIVLRALATRKRDRYESIRYFRDDLEAILGDV